MSLISRERKEGTLEPLITIFQLPYPSPMSQLITTFGAIVKPIEVVLKSSRCHQKMRCLHRLSFSRPGISEVIINCNVNSNCVLPGGPAWESW